MERRGGPEHPALLSELMILAGAAGVLAGLFVVRQLRQRMIENGSAARLPTGPDGVIIGAEPISLGTGGRGVLILHGFGDTPQSVRYLAERMHASGWTVRAPLLPGHGRTLREFARSRSEDWLQCARSELAAMLGECESVHLAGQSMGGALVAIVAREEPRVARLALLAPYLRMSRSGERLADHAAALSLVLPYVRSKIAGSLLDPAARAAALGFGVTTPRLMLELRKVVDRARAAAPAIRQPTLVISSERDPRIQVRDSDFAFQLLGGARKEHLWLADSGHVVAADRERDRVAATVAAWLGGEAGTPSG